MDDLELPGKFKIITSTINCIAPFSGDTTSLQNFLNRIDSLIPIIETLDAGSKRIILGLVKDKIIGDARKCLLTGNDPGTWPELKAILVRNHGEKVPSETLIDLIRTTKCDTTVGNFFTKINNLLCRLNNSYLLNGQNTEDQIQSNQRIAFHAFRQGLPEPVKSLVLCRNVTTIQQAIEVIQESGYFNFSLTRSQQYNQNFNRYPQYSNNQRPQNFYNYRNRQNSNQFANRAPQNYSSRQNANQVPNNVFQNYGARQNTNQIANPEPMDYSTTQTRNIRNTPNNFQGNNFRANRTGQNRNFNRNPNNNFNNSNFNPNLGCEPMDISMNAFSNPYNSDNTNHANLQIQNFSPEPEPRCTCRSESLEMHSNENFHIEAPNNCPM
jgi:hypothetical protein